LITQDKKIRDNFTGEFRYPVNHDLHFAVKQLNDKYEDCNLQLRNEIIWYKDHAGGKNALGSTGGCSYPVLRNDFEYISIWSKVSYKLPHTKEEYVSDIGDDYYNATLSVWNLPARTNWKKYPHPAPFSEPLVDRLIRLYSYLNSVVLDPMCGSDTVPAVAHRLGRRFIAVDQNKNYCEMSLERVRNAVQHDNKAQTGKVYDLKKAGNPSIIELGRAG